ncbi:MAG: RidA family protein [Planctomycetota bacterium]|nr:RidA family protein [Planctomycetota bacterium]
MVGPIDERSEELRITLPEPSPAFATHVPWRFGGNSVCISGQGPQTNGGKVVEKFRGKIGSDLTLEQGQEAAPLTTLNVIAQLKDACGGDLDRVRQCVQISGLVDCVDGFTETPSVVNGGSDVIVEADGEAGQHARSAVGSQALPAAAGLVRQAGGGCARGPNGLTRWPQKKVLSR